MKPVNILLSAFILFITGIATAQPENLVQTREQNKKWLWELEMLPLKEQIDRIQKRILLDTNTYESGKFKIKDQSAPSQHPLYIVDNVLITICKETSSVALIQLNELISNAITIKIVEEEQATPVYGMLSTGGVVLLQTNDKKTEEKMKKLKLTGAGADCN